jgi:hypothetical protein
MLLTSPFMVIWTMEAGTSRPLVVIDRRQKGRCAEERDGLPLMGKLIRSQITF